MAKDDLDTLASQANKIALHLQLNNTCPKCEKKITIPSLNTREGWQSRCSSCGTPLLMTPWGVLSDTSQNETAIPIKDRLDLMVERQESLMKQFGLHPNQMEFLPVGTREDLAFKVGYALMREVVETLDEMKSWKWFEQGRVIDESKITEEIIDCLHFVLELCLIYGMDAQDIWETYLEKNEKNHERIKDKLQKSKEIRHKMIQEKMNVQ